MVVDSNGGFKWNSDGGETSGSASEQSQNSSLNSKNAKRVTGFVSCCDHISEAANKRLRRTPMDSNKKAQLAQTLLSLGPLGLNLGETLPFIDLTEVIAPRKLKAKRSPEVKPNAFQLMTEKEKLKASNFNASFIRIGSWQRVAHNEGDLVVKCYYAKRKLVWEILDQGLKSKIEVQWSDISALRAVIEENEPGILEIELNQPPTFHRELNPQPRKHTMWNVASDFTNGQALIHRRHYVQFPPGALDQHYEKLIQCESRFLEMSRRPFPSQKSPYFQSDFHNGLAEFSFKFDRHGAEIPSNLQFPFSPCVQTRYDRAQQVQTYEQLKPTLMIKDSTSPISVMDFSSPLDDVIGNQAVQNPQMPVYWDQGITQAMTSFSDFLGREQLPGLVSVAQANSTISCQSFNVYNQGLGNPNPNSQLLSNIENQLMIDSQIEFSNKQVMPQANSLIAFPEQMNYAFAADVRHPDYVQELADNQNLVSGANVDLLQPQPVSWVLPLPQPGIRVAARNSGIQMAKNNSASSSFTQNLTMEDFATHNNLGNRWK
ncbi:unnamed protein product [Malus baccata var. baccata]